MRILRPARTTRVISIQKMLLSYRIPGWLFYDFHNQDPLAPRILDLLPAKNRTRRWYYFIPAIGDPVKLVHRIEPEALEELPGDKILYSGRLELEEMLRKILPPSQRVCMQYSPRGAVPYISRVDAGVVELVRSFGVDVVSSADLVQALEATLTKKELETHRHAAIFLYDSIKAAFSKIASALQFGDALTELSLQEWLVQRFQEHQFTSDHPPIVAVDAHSGNPHYCPSIKTNLPIRPKSFVLLDLWGKKKEEEAIYADICWVGYAGNEVPEKIRELFHVVRDARDAALEFLRYRFQADYPVFGYEVDDKARQKIQSKGYGEYFTHRTGHSIGPEVHWVGANMDNFETEELRRILPKTCFSVEPGIYLKEFGVRSEVNVYVHADDIEVNPLELQKEVVVIGHPGKR